MEKPGVEAILFDLDNTLVETEEAGNAAIAQVCKLLKTQLNGTNVREICERFSRKLLTESFDPSTGKTIDDHRINHWREALREAGVASGCSLASDCYHTWKTTRLQALAFSPATLALLKELRSSYKLLLLTNGEAQVQREKIQALQCEELFHAVVVGGEHAEQKPARSIFTYCFELLGVKPQGCVMVGDSLDTDIQGGFDAGVRATVWINKRGASVPENAATPDYITHSVLDLPKILMRLS